MLILRMIDSFRLKLYDVLFIYNEQTLVPT